MSQWDRLGGEASELFDGALQVVRNLHLIETQAGNLPGIDSAHPTYAKAVEDVKRYLDGISEVADELKAFADSASALV